MIIKQEEPNMPNYIITQQDKELLLQYLSMALLSGVKCQKFDDNCGYTLLGIDGDVLHIDYPVYDEGDGYIKVDYCKPYLRPMSSITLEEIEEFRHFKDYLRESECKIHIANYNQIQWLLEKHFDFMGLIPKGLAIEVTEENNPYK